MRYIRCNFCGATNLRSRDLCRRCGGKIAINPKSSLQTAFAFLVAAIIFYIPANIYPILETSKFGTPEASTILEGVIAMYKAGDYPVAMIIFIASVLIPILKFIVLFYILFSLWRKKCKKLEQKIWLYHLIEFTGPWSLIDVFVVVILVALIHFKNIAIIPGIGATSFALMVVLTMISALSIDVRVLGEKCER